MKPLPRRVGDVFPFAAGCAASCRAAGALWKREAPDIVVGLGGFASVPVALMASKSRTPLVLLEQNVVPGRATSFLAPLARNLCLGYESTSHLTRRTLNRSIVCGNPLREDILRAPSPEVTGTPGSKPNLLVLGGSQGATGLNSLVLSTVSRLRTQLGDWKVVHQSGDRDAPRLRAGYRQLGVDADVAAYFDDLPQRYRGAHLVISRAGATTLAELACCGRPAILIPYPRSSRDHQRKNAGLFARVGAAEVVMEGPQALEQLVQAVAVLAEDPGRRELMSRAMNGLARPEATRAVADVIETHLAMHQRDREPARRAA